MLTYIQSWGKQRLVWLGYTAKGIGVSTCTQAETLEELRAAVKDTVNCHFNEPRPRLIRLHLVCEEVFAA